MATAGWKSVTPRTTTRRSCAATYGLVRREWTLELPSPPNGPTFSADFDGDGKGEFLIGGFCIGTNDQGKGELRWQAPYSMGWGAIADFDGDGVGEIACQASGSVVILRAKPSQAAATGR